MFLIDKLRVVHFLRTVFPICTMCKLRWVGGLKKVGGANYSYCIIWIVSPGLTFKKGVLTTYLPIENTLYTGAYFRGGLMFGRGLTFQIIQYLCKLRGGWVVGLVRIRTLCKLEKPYAKMDDPLGCAKLSLCFPSFCHLKT